MLLNEITLHPEKLKIGQQLSLKKYKEDKLQEWVKIHCSDFLFIAGNKKLYRGIANEIRPVFMGYPRENRTSVDPWSNEAAERTDNLMKLAGWPARRSNSIFCNSSKVEAAVWGKLYEIYPINGFTFGYSKMHTGSNAGCYDSYMYALNKSDAKEFIEQNKLFKTNLKWPIEHEYDVWIRGAYIAFRC